MRPLILLALLGACAAPVAQAPGPALLVAANSHPLDGALMDASGAPVSEAALAAALAEADIAILGEIHDNPLQHDRQALLVRKIAPRGIAFEMVPEGSEEGVQALLAEGGTPGEIGPAIGWDRSGWPDWAMYRPVFEAAAGAYVAGAGVATADLRRAIGEGAAAVEPGSAARLGLDLPLPAAAQAAAEAEMIASHCGKLPAAAAPGMVEAQRLRDARFAAATLRARERGQGRAVLITGNGHARGDRGVPVYLRHADPGLKIVTLGQFETAPGANSLDDYREDGAIPYDFVWFSPPAERPDPCAGFK